jgi:hypothetical protein
MPDTPDRAELEAAIYRHFSLQPARGTTDAVIVKVAELEPVTWPPDSKQLRAGLFLSVPFLGGDRTKLDQALARVRKGFKRVERTLAWLHHFKRLLVRYDRRHEIPRASSRSAGASSASGGFGSHSDSSS